jgi:hypothetical protein
MAYTYKSLTVVWLVTLGLFALAGSGELAGPRLLLLLAVALATPAFILEKVAHRAYPSAAGSVNRPTPPRHASRSQER